MTTTSRLYRPGAAFLMVVLASTACSTATTGAPVEPGRGRGPLSPVAPLPHSAADVRFMSGMIPHHAQAVLIAGWAASHGARADVQILAERIVVAQQDEIALIQTWLRDRNEPVPDANPMHATMRMNGGEHTMLMPGMLSAEELAQLERARGTDFDRLFLESMIRHHEGAVTMVDELFSSYGAAQDEVVFRFASDVYADQTTEINRMYSMLETLPSDG